MQAAGKDEPIPLNRVGDAGRVGLDRTTRASRWQGRLRGGGCFDWQIAGPKTSNRKVLDPTAADRRCEQRRSIKAELGHSPRDQE
jgi:hypothetical protein